MHDDNLKKIFDNYDPALSDSYAFMTRLKARMDAVELLKEHNRTIARRNTRAIIIGTMAGFMAGIALTLVMPYITHLLAQLAGNIPSTLEISSLNTSDLAALTDNYRLPAWLIVGTLASMTSMLVFRLAASPLRPGHARITCR